MPHLETGGGQPQGEGPSGSAGGLEGTRFHVLQQKADGQKLSHCTLLAPFVAKEGRVKGTSPRRAEASRVGRNVRGKQKQPIDF